MENLIAFKGVAPRIHESSYVDPTARVIGDVVIEEGASVWPCSVIRADEEHIVIERFSAVLDHALIEAPKGFPVEVGEYVLVSHGAILHGCKVEEGALIGAGAIVLDGAKVGRGAIVGAGAVDLAGSTVPSKTLMVGVPSKPARTVTVEEAQKVREELNRVINKAAEYRKLY